MVALGGRGHIIPLCINLLGSFSLLHVKSECYYICAIA